MIVAPFVWSVGVTTAPRYRSTLVRCLQSLAAAGWTQPHVFAEPDAPVPLETTHLRVTRRATCLGAFPNWYLALVELVFSEPNADAYFVSQDDVLYAMGLRSYLERTLWPNNELGVVSVYCPSHYSRGRPTGYHVENHGKDTWGALAYVFPQASAREIICDRHVVSHRFEGPHAGTRSIDAVVGAWCERTRRPYFVHYPSLAQHIGDVSTLKRSPNVGKRQARVFIDDVQKLV